MQFSDEIGTLSISRKISGCIFNLDMPKNIRPQQTQQRTFWI